MSATCKNAKHEWKSTSIRGFDPSDYKALLRQGKERLAVCGPLVLAVTPSKGVAIKNWPVRVLDRRAETAEEKDEYDKVRGNKVDDIVMPCLNAYADCNPESYVAHFREQESFSRRKSEHVMNMLYVLTDNDKSFVTARQLSLGGNHHHNSNNNSEKKKRRMSAREQEEAEERGQTEEASEQEEEEEEENDEEGEEEEEEEQEEERKKPRRDEPVVAVPLPPAPSSGTRDPSRPLLPPRQGGRRDVNATPSSVQCAAAAASVNAAAAAEASAEETEKERGEPPCPPTIEPGAPALRVGGCNETLCSSGVQEACTKALDGTFPLELPKCGHGNVLHPADVARHVPAALFTRLHAKLRDGVRLMKQQTDVAYDPERRTLVKLPRWPDFDRRFDLGAWNLLAKSDQRACRFPRCGAVLPAPPRPGETLLQCAKCPRLTCVFCGDLCTDDPVGHAGLCSAGNGSGLVGGPSSSSPAAVPAPPPRADPPASPTA